MTTTKFTLACTNYYTAWAVYTATAAKADAARTKANEAYDYAILACAAAAYPDTIYFTTAHRAASATARVAAVKAAQDAWADYARAVAVSAAYASYADADYVLAEAALAACDAAR